MAAPRRGELIHTLEHIARRRLILLVLAPAVATCERRAPEGPAAEILIRDSANIEVVENYAPAWDSTRYWTVDPEPVFAIGGYSGAPDSANTSHLVWNILNAAPLSDGRVAMFSSSGENKVLVFESSGELSASFGRQGQGPGEFSHPVRLQVLPGDTIVVWDRMFRPVSYFDPAGNLLRHRRIDFGALVATLATDEILKESVGVPLLDGSFIVEVERLDWEPPSEGVYQPPVAYARIDSSYASHRFGWWDGVETLAMSGFSPAIVPFQKRSIITGGGNPLTVYVAPGDRYEVHQFSAAGILQRIIRRKVDPIPVESEKLKEWIDRVVTRNPHFDWSAWKRAVAVLPQRFHDPINVLRVDTAGYLWTMDRRGDGTSEWSVYDPAGRWLGTLNIPMPKVTWIGDLVVGVRTDPVTGAETVEGYRLHRNGGGR